jgi:hypothetical protein
MSIFQQVVEMPFYECDQQECIGLDCWRPFSVGDHADDDVG